MDIHRKVLDATPETVRKVHVSDLEAQERFGVRYLKYWFDQSRATICCLIEAPNPDAGQACHRAAHGNEATEVIEVESGLIESFLGGPTDDLGAALIDDGQLDGAFRTIMFTDIEGSTEMTERLGDDQAVHMVGVHDRLTRDALSRHGGREVKHTGDGVMASFVDASRAVACAIDMQRAFATHAANTRPSRCDPDRPERGRAGQSQPRSVRRDRQPGPAGVRRRGPRRRSLSAVVRDLCAGKSYSFEDRGQASSKGFRSRPACSRCLTRAG